MDMQGLASGAHGLWGYHRENYLYDRKMRQEQEYQIMDYRKMQTALWREDVRDLIALTQRKMDSYHVICALSLEYCITMFTEGRLEAGTPRWLLRFYLLTLGAAFSYMLIAIWFCMHAAVVAQSTSARLLTQFVRLCIPTWQQLEAARTYSVAFESMPLRQILRVPLLRSMPMSHEEAARPADWERNQRLRHVVGTEEESLLEGEDAGSSSGRPTFADPWGLEYEAGAAISELQPLPTAERRHAKLVRRVSVHYQTYDSWARVCMTFGMIQLLYALNYFCFGYLSVQEGSPASAAVVGIIFMSLAFLILELDWSLTTWERRVAEILMAVAPIFAFAAVFWTTVLGSEMRDSHRIFVAIVLPPAFASHALWFMWAVRTLGVGETRNGAVLPLKFRAVLYLDVFGWLHGKAQCHRGGEPRAGAVEQVQKIRKLLEAAQSELSIWNSDDVMDILSTEELAQVKEHMEDLRRIEGICEKALIIGDDDIEAADGLGSFSWRWLELHTKTPAGADVPYYFDLHAVGKPTASRRRVPRPKDGNILSMRETTERMETLMELVYSHTATHPPLPDDVEDHRKGGFFRRLFRNFLRRSKQSEEHPDQPHATGIGHGTARVEGHNVQLSDIDLFSPVTFYPYGKASARDETICAGEPIVTGHDHWKPGVVPARIFHSFTTLMAVLWFCALLLGFDVAFGFASFETETLPSVEEKVMEKAKESAEGRDEGLRVVEGESITGERVYLERRSLTPMPGGKRLRLQFPHKRQLLAKSFTCDELGEVFLLADAVSVYAAQADAPGFASHVAANLSFRPVAPCGALEGYSVRDVEVDCTEPNPSGGACHFHALVSRPVHVVKCPVFGTERAASTDKEADCPVANGTVMQFRSGWLASNDGETPIALATSRCEQLAEHRRFLASMESASTDEHPEGSFRFLLATSLGRVVAANSEVESQELDAESMLLRHGLGAGGGAIAVLPQEGCNHPVLLLLDQEKRTLQAVQSGMGQTLGEWTLPSTVTWHGTCAAKNGIYVMGREKHGKTGARSVVWRYPIPEALTKGRSQHAGATGNTTWLSASLQM